MDIQLPQQQEPESPCWGPTLHTCPSHFRRTTGYYTEKNSSQHYLPHPWPPTTISEAGEVPWSHSIGQTILDPTHWDGHQKGEQHTGFSPSEHFQMSKRCQGEMLQKLGLPQPRICKLCMGPQQHEQHTATGSSTKTSRPFCQWRLPHYKQCFTHDKHYRLEVASTPPSTIQACYAVSHYQPISCHIQPYFQPSSVTTRGHQLG